MNAPRIAGVDEAGRGPLAGPVVVSAVVLDPARPIAGLDDSKRLSARRRESLAEQIRASALGWSVIEVEADEIDRLNILQATLTGMRRAVEALSIRIDEVLIDGNRVPAGLSLPARAIVGGDALQPAISAASILAKTVRDARLVELDSQFPGYGFAVHKGYPTPAHLQALRQLGPCAAHRRSFAPVRNCPIQADFWTRPVPWGRTADS
ncbi:MAG: ribonuclease HII [Xanthomonadales bacterium]|nr:ribonuclease HII [Xanthomonadales bacterium]